MNVNLDNTYWEKIVGYPTELRVDARWLLKKHGDDRTYGSLRIVSHPDLPPGQLRSFFTYVKAIRQKSDAEIMQSVEDYQMELIELEVFSVSEDFETVSDTYEAPFKELEELFGVKIFKK